MHPDFSAAKIKKKVQITQATMVNVFPLPLAAVVCNMRLIPAMEVSSRVQRERSHRWLSLELDDVHVVLN